MLVNATMLQYVCGMGSGKKTKSLMLLLEAFEQSNDAISTSDLVRQLNQKMNKTTVYRILQRLEDRGTLHSFTGKDGLKWYAKCKGFAEDKKLDTHPHFQCKICGKVECLNLGISIPAVPHYKIESAELLLVGECNECLS